MLDALGHILLVLAIILGAAFAVWVLSHLRNGLVALIGYIARFIVIALATAVRGLRAAQTHLRLAAENALAGLAYRGRHADEAEEPSAYRGWDVIGPLVYFGAVILMALGDFYLMILRFRTLLNMSGDPPKFALPIDELMGILWLVTVAVYGSVLFDLHGVSPIARPFHGASARLRKWLRVIAWFGVIAAFVAGGLLWLWGDLAIQGNNTHLGTVFTVMFAVLLLGALVLASWSVAPAFVALWFLLVSVLRIVVWCLALVCSLLVRLVDALAHMLVALVDVFARLGLALHNHLAGFAWAQRLRWKPRPPFAVLAPIAAELSRGVLSDTDDGFSAASSTDALFLNPRSPVLLPAPPPAPRNDSRATITVLSVGAVGSALMANLWPALKGQLPLRALLAVGAFDESATEHPERYGVDGVLDVSPTAKEIADEQRTSLDVADFRRRLLSGMLRRVRQSLITVDAMEGQVILLAGPEVLDETTCELVADLKRRRPEQEIILVCSNLWLDSKDRGVVEAFKRLGRMHTEGVVAAVLLPSTTRKEDARRVGIALASLIGARVYDLENPSLVGVAKRLAANGPFIELRASAIEVDATLSADGPIFARHKPIVSIRDAMTQARHLSAPMLKPDTMGVLVYTVPLRPRDELWSRFCDAMRTWLDRQTEGGSAVLPVFMPGRQLEIHAAALYPLAQVRALATHLEPLAQLTPNIDEGPEPTSETPDSEAPVVVAAASPSANGAHPAAATPPSDEPPGMN